MNKHLNNLKFIILYGVITFGQYSNYESILPKFSVVQRRSISLSASSSEAHASRDHFFVH